MGFSILSLLYFLWFTLAGIYTLIGITQVFNKLLKTKIKLIYSLIFKHAHKKFLGMLFLLGFDTILNSFLFIFFAVSEIAFLYRLLSFGFIVFVILDIYCFVVILSLKRKIELEEEKRMNPVINASAPTEEIIVT
jgi:hypothetical protein